MPVDKKSVSRELSVKPRAVGNVLKKTADLDDLAAASPQDLLRELLLRLGEDPDRDGLIKTPERMYKAL